VRTRTLLVLLFGGLACAGCKSQKSTDELIADLKSSQEKDRIIAVRLLPQRTDDADRVIPALIETLKESDGDVRWSAAIGLGTFGDRAKAAIPALQAALHDKDARVREAAGKAISRIDPSQAPKPAAGKGAGK
jgi:HEAT repeat protein